MCELGFKNEQITTKTKYREKRFLAVFLAIFHLDAKNVR